jgi:hypothetical protein
MKFLSQAPVRSLFTIFLSFCITFNLHAQGFSKIDLSKDTISMADANASRTEYRNGVRGRATEKISLPVDKLKEVLDACAAKGIEKVDVLIGKVRPGDIAHYKNFNRDANDNDLLGIQVIILRVPRRAFAGQMGAKINLTKNNPLMLSLLTAGLALVDAEKVGLTGSGEDLYFSFGSICPPPTSCDTN